MHISLVIYLLWKTAQSPSVFPEEHLYPERWPLESLFDLRLVDFYQDSYFLGKHGKVGELNMPVRWETQRRQLNETYQMTVTCFTRRSPRDAGSVLAGKMGYGKPFRSCILPQQIMVRKRTRDLWSKTFVGDSMLLIPFLRVLTGELRAQRCGSHQLMLDQRWSLST